MKDGVFLSEAVDLNALCSDRLNLIVAPCGSGKTTLALHELPQKYCAPERSVYLIDTTAGMEQLLQNVECQEYEKNFLDVVSCFKNPLSKKITVMTYARFGALCERYPDWYRDLDTIICDELHKLLEMMLWREDGKAEKNVHEVAWDAIKGCLEQSDCPMVIAMTATPDRIFKALNGWVRISPDTGCAEWYASAINRLPVKERVRRYRPKEVQHYKNLGLLCSTLPEDKKGIVYVSRIGEIKRCVEQFQARGIHAVGIWSVHNSEHEMTDEQRSVRKHIIQHAAIPEDVDVLVINKSCETSINIKSTVDYMVVHSTVKDTMFQAMGRYRGNIPILYLYKPEAKSGIELPEGMLEVALYKEDIDAFVQANNIRKSNGVLMGAPTFYKLLGQSGYRVEHKKEQGGKRYVVIHEAEE